MDTELHGGNYPQKGPGEEDFGDTTGGALNKGLAMQKRFMDEMPEEMGLGNAGPNQMPIGCPAHSAKRGHRFG